MAEVMNNTTSYSELVTNNDNICQQCSFDLSKSELPIVLLLTLILNAIAIYILIKIRPTCISVDHTCVLVLAVNDFVTAALYSVMWIGGWIKCGCLMDRHVCNVLGWFATSMVIWSAWVVIIMAGCRYLATVKPIYYRTHVTIANVQVSMVVTLCLTFLQLIFPFFGVAAQYKFYPGNKICAYDFSPGAGGSAHRWMLGFLSAEGLLASLVVLYLNVSIICKMRQKNTIHTECSTISTNLQQTKKTALANVTKVVSAVFFICYTPFLVRVMYDVITNATDQNATHHQITMVLLFLSPLLNPFIYVGCNRRYREYIIKRSKAVWTKIRPHVPSSDEGQSAGTVTVTVGNGQQTTECVTTQV